MEYAVELNDVDFDYDQGLNILKNVSLKVEKGSRVCITGANGTGKSTLMRLIAGKHYHEKEKVMVFGKSAFFECKSSEEIAYVGTEWRDNPIVRSDIEVRTQETPSECIRCGRELEYEKTFGWTKKKSSAGDEPHQTVKLMLLDEVSVDLDLLARVSLLEYLKQESEQRGVTIIYATHIFDSILHWSTHILHLSNGKVARFGKMNDFEELQEKNWQIGVSPLISLVEKWLREEDKEKREMAKNGLLEKKKESLIEKLAMKSDKYYNYWN